MAFVHRLQDPWRYIKAFVKWSVLALLMGTIGGLLGAGFHHALHGVTQLRSEHNWLIFLLPAGGLLSVAIYRLFRLQSNRGTNEIIDAVLEGSSVKPQIAPTIFLSTALTHLLGGSAASLLAKMCRLEQNDRKILIMSGMSAVFAGLFGTPLTATLFCMEFESVGTIFSPALLPCFLAAFTASRVSGTLGVHAETAQITAAVLTWGNIWKFAVLAVLLALLGIAMCALFHKTEHMMAHLFKNP